MRRSGSVEPAYEIGGYLAGDTILIAGTCEGVLLPFGMSCCP
jgi:hypothetical protein